MCTRFQLFQRIDLQKNTSAATHEVQVDGAIFKTYPLPRNFRVLLPPIVDNTQGVAAFADILFPQANLLVDLGGGSSDVCKH